jgi:hypothetical protein
MKESKRKEWRDERLGRKRGRQVDLRMRINGISRLKSKGYRAYF